MNRRELMTRLQAMPVWWFVLAGTTLGLFVYIVLVIMLKLVE